MISPVSIVDLFSGPGGLGEGFAAVPGASGQAYRIEVSVEKEATAHATLRLRAFLRRFPILPEYLGWLRRGGVQPDWSTLYPTDWAAAEHEACCLELGSEAGTDLLEARIQSLEASGQKKTLLIGGPPCQAYSLVGRSRNAGIAGYDAIKDHRNFLYEEYVRVLNRLKPVVFVMENVKGILSSSVQGRAIFASVTRDLMAAGDGYRLFALSAEGRLTGDPGPKDFIVRAEDHGVPQARHRVIIVGVRADVADRLPVELAPRLTKSDRVVTVKQTIQDLPKLRSGISRGDSPAAWLDAMLAAIDRVEAALADSEVAHPGAFRAILEEMRANVGTTATLGRGGNTLTAVSLDLPTNLADWLSGRASGVVTHHDTRGHMPSDLSRYLFAACHARIEGVSPRAAAFPASLAPDHRNWNSGKFNDRFRVQLADQPSSTITSHISKDGHYFIHPDPFQCRSLTVREAARLQTFPDDYVFLGNRTQQYVQVGNAVPPWLARQIAEAVLPIYDRI
ncbi:DNA cytosine methyltransferase [Cypionkella sp.]|uniref:DNA cytosine methyltransferase n=1 Tax=Cypionkella sp. TaxID=2811411 RepID=UPI002ABADF0A|nr:DNA cytosine methyltransferase [Cypionkella sp.]MDZ4395796.1 DNA cytosine methyltransferase [Cypionkella sp.]